MLNMRLVEAAPRSKAVGCAHLKMPARTIMILLLLLAIAILRRCSVCEFVGLHLGRSNLSGCCFQSVLVLEHFSSHLRSVKLTAGSREEKGMLVHGSICSTSGRSFPCDLFTCAK